MPLFFSEASKRQKNGDRTGGTAPVFIASSPLPYPLSTPTAVYQQQPPLWPQPQGHYVGPVPQPYGGSTVSLPPNCNGQVDCSTASLQPQHTWPQSQTIHAHSGPPRLAGYGLQEKIGDKLGDVISLIDEEAFSGSSEELAITLQESGSGDDGGIYSAAQQSRRALVRQEKAQPPPKPAGQEKEVNVFSKVDLYMNSRLPASLPPLRVYMPTYPLLCLAAQCSASAYYSPRSTAERKDFVSADSRLGTKAMVIKSIPCDDKKTIVFAIRGTSMLSIRDWGVNLSTEPVSPAGFLDDAGNLCHSGFLKVAKAMVRPIAARLRHLLEENPNRTSCSLLITGHSAGGAVASLLYAHMLAETVESELNVLTGCFKRVHCIAFGAPPVSLLALQKPDSADGRLRKCLFHSFINEGDPVVRAERAYVKSLVDLLARPIPSFPANKTKTDTKAKIEAITTCPSTAPLNMLGASISRLDLSLNPTKKPKAKQPKSKPSLPTRKLWWEVPPATLSNAGRLIVLRVPDGGKESDVTASIVKDEQLRQVIFGDPLAHAMDLYARRIEALAVRAVTGRNGAC
ncbi:hypothetical protein A1O3_02263 [Capronia epimyces CBS 606.96]|uniref:Fungal lipase-type domain-containing protein n=1 Tax=Capronia epimyces CBS 606.96 TaxID=1182542 RepID=W9Y8L4_9EURO|nr:uncharacterized protein A1O3_02263 [Capronia epimyces CBS 606.96]EXJ89197.1 hypothetical protein A1O3_02263 [Capronia epimyces CBS 606.96]